jgi:hypothetical protein
MAASVLHGLRHAACTAQCLKSIHPGGLIVYDYMSLQRIWAVCCCCAGFRGIVVITADSSQQPNPGDPSKYKATNQPLGF